MSKIAISKNSVRKLPSSRPRALKKESPQLEENWMMRLYVAGQSARSTAAIANLRRICDRYMPGRCTVEIVGNPELAKPRSDHRDPDIGEKNPGAGKADNRRSVRDREDSSQLRAW